jgi:hypothetical protein
MTLFDYQSMYDYGQKDTPVQEPADKTPYGVPAYTPGVNLLDSYLYGIEPGKGGMQAPSDIEGTLGPFGRETMESLAEENLGKSSSIGLAAHMMGAPAGAAVKAGLTSIGPMGALGAIAKMAYSGLLDKAYDDALSEAGIDQSKVSMEDYDAAKKAMDVAKEYGRPMEVAPVGYDAQYAAAQKAQMDDDGFVGRLGMAFNALKDIFQPTSDKMGTTDFSRATGLHPGMQGAPSGQLAAEVAGLRSSYGDPFGTGIGGGGSSGGGSAGRGMSDAGGFGTGDRGDREGGGWV